MIVTKIKRPWKIFNQYQDSIGLVKVYDSVSIAKNISSQVRCKLKIWRIVDIYTVYGIIQKFTVLSQTYMIIFRILHIWYVLSRYLHIYLNLYAF